MKGSNKQLNVKNCIFVKPISLIAETCTSSDMWSREKYIVAIEWTIVYFVAIAQITVAIRLCAHILLPCCHTLSLLVRHHKGFRGTFVKKISHPSRFRGRTSGYNKSLVAV